MKLSIILPCKYNYCICTQNCSSLSVCILNSHIDIDSSQKREACAQSLEVPLGKGRKGKKSLRREGRGRSGVAEKEPSRHVAEKWLIKRWRMM